METTQIIVIVIAAGFIAYFLYELLKKTDNLPKPKPEPDDETWWPLIFDLKTALVGIVDEAELEILLAEFEPRIKKYSTNLQFRSEYNKLIENWKNNH